MGVSGRAVFLHLIASIWLSLCYQEQSLLTFKISVPENIVKMWKSVESSVLSWAVYTWAPEPGQASVGGRGAGRRHSLTLPLAIPAASV